MSEQPSRIGEAKLRALAAKRKLGIGAAAAFVAIFGLAWVSHPGSKSQVSTTGASASDGSSFEQDDSYFEQDDDDFGGFDSFGSIAPSGGSAPQAQTHVS